MRRVLIAGLVALGLMLGLAACTPAAEETPGSKVKSSGVLRVGTEGTYSPFSFHDPATNELTGYDVEVITAVAETMGVKAEFTEAPWDSIFATLMSDRFDVVANQVTRNPEREALYALSDPYTVSKGVIITRADDNSITSLADLKGRTVAQSSTSNWAEVATKAGAKVEAIEGFSQAVTLVKQGRVDATINDNLAALEYFASTGDTAVKQAAETGDVSEQVFALRPGDTVLRDEINTALTTLRANGRLAEISTKYFKEDISQGTKSTGAGAAAEKPSAWQLIKDAAGPMAWGMIKGTIPLTVISFVIGLVIALVIALMRLSSITIVSQIARVYISIIRGTPLLVQLFLIFYGLPAIGLTFNSFTAAIIAFSLNVGGYAAEIIRSSILSVPSGQREAALTLGMGYTTTLRRVILPQAARIAIPPLSNTLISLVKDTSLASVVLFTEVLRVAQIMAAPTFQFFALYGLAAVYYWVVCLVLSFGQGRLETRLSRYVTR